MGKKPTSTPKSGRSRSRKSPSDVDLLHGIAEDKALDLSPLVSRFPGVSESEIRSRLQQIADQVELKPEKAPSKKTTKAKEVSSSPPSPPVARDKSPTRWIDGPGGTPVIDLGLVRTKGIVRVERMRVFIDGCSKGNPGPAAIGVVFGTMEDETLTEGGAILGKMTNNVAEYHALLAALTQARNWEKEEIEVFTDSELLVRQMNGSYSVKSSALATLYKAAKALRSAFRYCAIRHIPREKNRRADELANLAIRRKLPGRLEEV